jgi:diphthamide synthase (EF-2-diphthine--ammonia ligase)
VAMHGVRRELLEAQAASAGLPLRTIPLPDPCSNENYEARMGEAMKWALEGGFTHVAFGDLFLQDVRSYREERLAGTGLEPLFPVWGIPTAQLAEHMIGAGVRARISCVDTRVLPASFVGREFDRELLRDLPHGIDPCGENGEFHTCVYGGPMFRTPLLIEPGDTVARDVFVWRDLVCLSTRAASSA